MSVASGARLGPYEITAKLGEGGMGEVYRATDTKLKRDVAIKVLPAAFTEDKERLARFEREAQLLAQLHHPNIASIFGLEESEGTRALVMELVEGPTLAERLEQGPLPFSECLSVSLQIAQALEEAHEKGIVHRDLKPQNIKASLEGKVKVLDFGLAKAMDPLGAASGAGSASQLAASPTLTLGATVQGMILGTAAYMAPEQAKGLPIDRRADIWAFGVVLYEMLTGRSLFAGDSVAETLAGVLKSEVDLAKLPDSTPAAVRNLLRRCLERNPKSRLRDIGEARLILVGVEKGESESSPDSTAAGSSVAAPRSSSLSPLWVVPALLVVAGFSAFVGWRARPTPVAPTVHLSIALPRGEQITTAPAISPDGQTIAYVAGRSAATSRLYVRRLSDSVARAVDSGASATWPFFSPDGNSIAFFAGGKLWRAAVNGSAASVVASAPRAFGGTWAADGTIVYSPMLNAGLWRVPANGGKPEQLTKPDAAEEGYAHVFPQALPNGELLFQHWGKTFYARVLSPSSGARRAVTADAARGLVTFYSGNGFLLRGDHTANLLAARWQPSDKALVLPQAVAVENVYWYSGTDRSYFSVAPNGTAVFAPGSPDRRHLVWVARDGVVTEVTPEPDLMNVASVSPDGRFLVHNGRSALWVRDLVAGTRTRVLSDITWCFPGGWLPGGNRFAVSSNVSGDWEIYAMRVGGGALEPLLKRPGTQHPMDVAPDGTLVFLEYGEATGIDIWTLSPDGEAKPLIVTPFQDSAPRLSGDGRMLAFTSDESGRQEVYVIPIGGGERTAVSLDGGSGPVWSPDGRELFYRAGDDLVGVELRSTSPLVLGERKKLLDVSGFEAQSFHEFEVSPDGQRFLFLRAEPDSRPTRLDVILNWFPELENKVPS